MHTLGHSAITLHQLQQLVASTTPIALHPSALAAVLESFDFLKQRAAHQTIYGVNTGFGPMAQHAIAPSEQLALQYNLIRSHCAGMGAALPTSVVRAAMICQLNTLLIGKSGVAPELLHLIVQLLNHGIHPVVYEHGGVGASGDLVQLAHLALGYLGEGQVWHQGQQQPATAVFKRYNIAPLRIHLREGLALMNGTAVMTGMGLLNVAAARNLLDWALLASALLNEVVSAYDDHLSAPLNAAKAHTSQHQVAALLRHLLGNSQRLQARPTQLNQTSTQTFDRKVQEYYSLRCLPQILGPIHETIAHSTAILEREANSVQDNPVVDVATQTIYHGGNFHGDYVALAMDHLRLAMTKLSILAERQLNFLLHPALNGQLPPFVNRGKLGLNFGLQGAQFTATSTTAENQMLANSIYIHSIPSNNDNQDIVSMGTNAASMTWRVIENGYQVLAVEFWALVQAIESLDIASNLSPLTRQYYQSIKEHLPAFQEDRPLYPRLQAFQIQLQEQQLDLWSLLADTTA